MITAPKKAAAPKGAVVEKLKAGNKRSALQRPLQPSAELAAVVETVLGIEKVTMFKMNKLLSQHLN